MPQTPVEGLNLRFIKKTWTKIEQTLEYRDQNTILTSNTTRKSKGF